jgi:hypothetical protein
MRRATPPPWTETSDGSAARGGFSEAAGVEERMVVRWMLGPSQLYDV